jgi:hypothetical protein
MQVLAHISDELAAVHGLLAGMLVLEETHNEDSIVAEVCVCVVCPLTGATL